MTYNNCHCKYNTVGDSSPVAVFQHGLPKCGEEGSHTAVVDHKDKDNKRDVGTSVVVQSVEVLGVVFRELADSY